MQQKFIKDPHGTQIVLILNTDDKNQNSISIAAQKVLFSNELVTTLTESIDNKVDEFEMVSCVLENSVVAGAFFKKIRSQPFTNMKLSGNNFGKIGGLQIFRNQFYRKDWPIQNLDLSNNGLNSKQDIIFLQEILTNSPTIKKLNLSGNSNLFRAGGINDLAELIRSAKYLELLDITDTLDAVVLQNNDAFLQILNTCPKLAIKSGKVTFKAKQSPNVDSDSDIHIVNLPNSQGKPHYVELSLYQGRTRLTILNQIIEPDEQFNQQLAELLTSPNFYNPSFPNPVEYLGIKSCNIIKNSYTASFFNTLKGYEFENLNFSRSNFSKNGCLIYLLSDRQNPWRAKTIDLRINDFRAEHVNAMAQILVSFSPFQEVILFGNPFFITKFADLQQIILAAKHLRKINLTGSIGKSLTESKDLYKKMMMEEAPGLQVVGDEFLVDKTVSNNNSVASNVTTLQNINTLVGPNTLSAAPLQTSSLSPAHRIFTIENQEIVISNKSAILNDSYVGEVLDCMSVQQIFKLRIQQCGLSSNDPFLQTLVRMPSFKLFESLDFNYNNLGTGQGTAFLVEKLVNLPDLNKLALSNNNLTDRDLELLSKIKNLVSLDLSRNPRLNERGRLLNFIAAMDATQLTELNLLGCGLDASQTTISKLQQILNQNPNLEIQLDENIRQMLQSGSAPRSLKNVKPAAMDTDSSPPRVRFKTLNGYTPYFKIQDQTLILTSNATLKFDYSEILLNGIKKCINQYKINHIVVYQTNIDLMTLSALSAVLVTSANSTLANLVFNSCQISFEDMRSFVEDWSYNLEDRLYKNLDLNSLKTKVWEFHNCFDAIDISGLTKVAEVMVKLFSQLPLVFKTNSSALYTLMHQNVQATTKNSSTAQERISRIMFGQPLVVDPNSQPASIESSKEVHNIDSNVNSIAGPINNANINSITGSVNNANVNVVINSQPDDPQPMATEADAKKNPLDDDVNRIQPSELIRHKKIGLGGFGKVYSGLYKRQPVAIKTSELNEDDEIKDFFTEANLLNKLAHKNIVKFYGAVCTDGQYAIVLEHLEGGTLKSYINTCYKQDKNSSNDPQWKMFANQIAQGLNYLHTFEPVIIHGDIKSMNIMMRIMNGAKEVTIIDLNISRAEHTHTKSRTFTRGFGGTLLWLSPEQVLDKTGKVRSTTMSDMYAYGLVVWEMTTGKIPFNDENDRSLKNHYKTKWPDGMPSQNMPLAMPQSCDPKLSQVMTACFFKDPSKRATAADVLKILEPVQELTTLEFFGMNGISEFVL